MPEKQECIKLRSEKQPNVDFRSPDTNGFRGGLWQPAQNPWKKSFLIAANPPTTKFVVS
jgi:hypothetical protein